MSWGVRLQIVALVLVTSVLSSTLTAHWMKRSLEGMGMGLGMSARPSAAGTGNPMSITFGAPVDKEGYANLQTQVKARQATNESPDAYTIDLKPYVNASVKDPLVDSPGHKDHNFARLPLGIHTYGGVPFDVEGIIQLTGPSIPVGAKVWPEAVTNIAIGHSGKKIHLFQGAFNINGPGAHNPYAKLVLHYADNTDETLELLGGVNALKCTAPAAPPNLSMIEAPKTELGWLGSDSYLEGADPGEALHIYRTTLDNPKPDVIITSLDYVSSMVNPAPFMAGITIE